GADQAPAREVGKANRRETRRKLVGIAFGGADRLGVLDEAAGQLVALLARIAGGPLRGIRLADIDRSLGAGDLLIERMVALIVDRVDAGAVGGRHLGQRN